MEYGTIDGRIAMAKAILRCPSCGYVELYAKST
jgi:hypothetical protein